MFTNAMRDLSDYRGIGKRRFQGWVVNNDDTKRDDEKLHGLQHMQIRIADLHDNTSDADLPYFAPASLPSYSGASDMGHHGPIPPNGSKVWVEYEGDTQYHGVYLGAVQTDSNRIPEFTGKGRYAKSYPQVAGSVDASGSLHAEDHKVDSREFTHVSGTASHVDGKGNVMHVVNGDAKTGNDDASKLFPTGFNAVVFGGLNLWVSGPIVVNSKSAVTLAVVGDVNVSSKGNLAATVQGDATVSAKGAVNAYAGQDLFATAKGKATVAADGDAQVSSKANLWLSAESRIALDAPLITSKVAITIAGGKAPAETATPQTPSNVPDAKPPATRSRPEQSAPPSSATAAQDTAAQQATDTSTKDQSQAAVSSNDSQLKNLQDLRALVQLVSNPGATVAQLETTLTDAVTKYVSTVTRSA